MYVISLSPHKHLSITPRKIEIKKFKAASGVSESDMDSVIPR